MRKCVQFILTTVWIGLEKFCLVGALVFITVKHLTRARMATHIKNHWIWRLEVGGWVDDGSNGISTTLEYMPCKPNSGKSQSYIFVMPVRISIESIWCRCVSSPIPTEISVRTNGKRAICSYSCHPYRNIKYLRTFPFACFLLLRIHWIISMSIHLKILWIYPTLGFFIILFVWENCEYDFPCNIFKYYSFPHLFILV